MYSNGSKMGIRYKQFSKVSFKKKPYISGIQGQLELKQNGRKIDFMSFNDNNSYKRVVNVLKKYGFFYDYDKEIKKDVQDEIDNLNNFYK